MLKHTLAIALLLLPTSLFAQPPQPSSPSIPANTQSHVEHDSTEDFKRKAKKAKGQVTALEQEIKFQVKDKDPLKWARLQYQLAEWLACYPSENRAQDLQKSILACQQSLAIFTPESNDFYWIGAQAQLINNLLVYPTSTDAQRDQNIRLALPLLQQLISVIAKKNGSNAWRSTQEALTILPDTQRPDQARFKENLLKTIELCESTFTAQENTPQGRTWVKNARKAADMSTVAQLWMIMPFANDAQKTHDLQKAIAAWSVALALLPENIDTRATYQIYLADCWSMMPPADEEQKHRNLLIAAAIYQSVFEADPKNQSPQTTLQAALRLCETWRQMPSKTPEENAMNLQTTISTATEALRIASLRTTPDQYGALRVHLFGACGLLAELPAQDKPSLMRRAIANLKAALIVYTPEAHPGLNAVLLPHLERYQDAYHDAGLEKDVPFSSIKPAE